MSQMKNSRTHIAIVLDEFGAVDGLITIENIVEEMEKAISIFPDRAEPLYSLGAYCNKIGEHNLAYKYLTRALPIDINKVKEKYILFVDEQSYGKYVYDANGLPITLFPPGYSLLISVLFICCGQSVTPIMVLNTLIYTFLAILFYRKIVNNNKLFIIAFFSIYINIISGSYSMLLSETIFIPVFLFWYSIFMAISTFLGNCLGGT